MSNPQRPKNLVLLSHHVSPAAVSADESGSIRSEKFDDRYHSADGAVEESEHVFLRGNNLPEAWSGAERFVIAELGFGTGLNFLLAWELWQQTAPSAAVLHYVAFEQYPLSHEQITDQLAGYERLQALRDRLIEILPLRFSGFHRLTPAPDVFLTIVYGDANEYLPLLSGQVDAWFHDGFAPAKNPEIWSPLILKEIAEHSHAETTFATYSVAARLRDGLAALDFEVEKIRGFGKKNEMLVARSHSRTGSRTMRPRGRAVIIGGGLAGTAVARSLALRHWSSIILDREANLAGGASGNTAGVLMPHLSVKPDLLSRFSLAGYELALQQIKDWQRRGLRVRGELKGVLRLVSSTRLEKLLTGLPELGLPNDLASALTENEASALAQFQVRGSALYFPGGGWIHPPDVCRLQLEDAGLLTTCRFGTEAASITRTQSGWQVVDPSGRVLEEADAVILANGYESRRFSGAEWFPLESVRGQVALLRASDTSARLGLPVCYDGYVIPALDGEHLVGATFDHEMETNELNDEQNTDLVRRMYDWLPGFPRDASSVVGGRVSFRTMSRDRLPILGAVPDIEKLERRFSAGERLRVDDSMLLPGLYATLGHGSRGLSSCGLAAELIAAEICAEPHPIESDLAAAVAPARFLLRLLEKNMALTEPNLRSLKVPHLQGDVNHDRGKIDSV